jgi:DNA-binding response OmpR family regulator
MGRTILIVDDEPLMLKSLEMLFSREGYRTFTAKDAYEALKVLQEEKIDGVISDELMPGLKGKEFLAVVRRKFPESFRILLTAYPALDTLIPAINEAEVHRVILKPYNGNALLTQVKELLDRQEEVQMVKAALEAARRESDFGYKIITIMAATDWPLPEKYATILTLIADYIRVHALSLMILDPHGEHLVVQAATNERILGMKRSLHENAISSKVARDREPVWQAGEKKEVPGVLWHDRSVSQYRTAAFACVPIMGGKNIVGVLNLADPTEGEFSESTVSTASSFMRWVGVFISPAVESGEPSN